MTNTLRNLVVHYAYMEAFLFAAAAVLAIWITILWLSPSTRREQLIMTTVGFCLSPSLLLLAAADYRATSVEALMIGWPDFVFSSCLFGIAAVIYHLLLGKRAKAWRGTPAKLSKTTHWVSHLLVISGVWLFVSLAATLVFKLPSIQSFTIGALLVGIYMIADRKDLLLDALLSGLFVAMLVFVVDQLFFLRLFPEAAAAYWNGNVLSGIVLGGLPAEELVWAAVVGFAVGPLYEYVRHWRLV